MMDFRGTYRLFEVDHFSLPKDWADMRNFTYVYEALIIWALYASHTKEELIAQGFHRRELSRSLLVWGKLLQYAVTKPDKGDLYNDLHDVQCKTFQIFFGIRERYPNSWDVIDWHTGRRASMICNFLMAVNYFAFQVSSR